MESENLGIRPAALCKRRSGLFKKASELAILCDAEVAVIIINPDGNISEFASSSIQEILTKFKNCYKLWKSKKEVSNSKQIQTKEEEEEHNLIRNVVGKDLDLMSSDELDVLLEKINKGLMSAKERKTQLLNEELEQSRIQQEEALQRSQILMKQVGELQALAPHDIYCPMPLDVVEGDARATSSSEYVSSSITLAPITNGPETQNNFHNADTTTLILPSPATATATATATASRELYISNRASNTSAAASPVSAENRLNSTEKIYTPNLALSLAPTWG